MLVHEFFLSAPDGCSQWPPHTTAQTREVAINQATGKPYFYKPKALQNAENDIKRALLPYIPDAPLRDVPVRLIVKWLFPFNREHKKVAYKLTRPDTDNLQKLLKDCMTALSFWADDGLVCSEIVEKFWAERPGIYIRIEVMDDVSGAQ